MSSVIVQNTTNTTPMKAPVKGRSLMRVSAYSMFQKDTEQRNKVKSALGANATFGDISKGMSAAWKGLPDDDRAVYQTQSDKVKSETPSSSITSTNNTTTTTTTTTTTKGVKSKTIPKKLKRARSAYTLFTMDETVKAQVKDENPDADFGAQSKLLGAKWKTLSTEDRQPYHTTSNAEKASLASNSETSGVTITTKQRKRARSAYTLYSSDEKVREVVKSSNPDADFGAQSKIIAAQWKELSETDRQPYVEASEAEKTEMIATKLATGQPLTGKVRKRARSAYTLYTMDDEVKSKVKVDHPDASFTDFSKILAAQWKTLTDQDREKYTIASGKEKEEMAEKPSIQGTTKKPKQKRAKSAYTLYSSDPEVREKVTKANPEADFGTLSKLISAQWQGLSDQLKKPYLDASEKEKTEMALIKAANKPAKSRAKSAYLHFSMNSVVRNAAKSAHPDKSVTELAKVLGAQWKALTDDDRLPYKKAYDDEKAALEEAKASNSN